MIDITTWPSHYHQTRNILLIFDCPELKDDEDKEVLSYKEIYGNDKDKIRRVTQRLMERLETYYTRTGRKRLQTGHVTGMG